MNEKTCTHCEETKPVDAFSKRKSSRDGLQSWCKECIAPRAKKWREDNPERASANYRRWEVENRQRVRENRRAWMERNPGYMREYLKRWHRQNPGRLARQLRDYETRFPERTAARRSLNAAVKRGDIEKPETCACCAQPTSSRELQGHHHDYDRPLDVEWLCRQCHADFHKALRDESNAHSPDQNFDTT